MESQVKFQDSQQKSTEAISDKDRYLVLKCIKKDAISQTDFKKCFLHHF